MGQKVHPTGFRLGVNQDWRAHWIADKKDFAKYLLEDINIRKHIARRFPDADISRVIIDRAAGRVSITIYTGKPGVVIGRRGQEVEALRRELAEMTGKVVSVDIREVKVPETDAQIVASNIARRIEARASHRRAMKRAVDTALRMGAKGIKVRCKGRLGGRDIARAEWYLKGRVPLHTLRADIDYGFAEAKTTYGVIGVKVWIYKEDKDPRKARAESRGVLA